MAKKKNLIEQRRIITPMFRVSYPSVFEKTAFEDGVPEYSVTALFPKSTDMSAIRKAIKAAKVEKWGEDESDWPEEIRSPIRNGDKKKKDNPEYADHWYIRFNNKKKMPGVINADRSERLTTEDEFYAGCYARAQVCAYAYDKAGNKGVSFDLWNVQKIKDGESFGGRQDPFDVFDAVAVEDDEDEDKPKKKKKASDDDDFEEDEKPKKKKKAVEPEEDDEDDRPKKKKSKSVVEDDDDEDEDKPKKKKKAVEPEEDDDEDDDEPRKKKSAKKSKKSSDDDDDDDLGLWD